MKRKTEPTLAELRKEINRLKLEKERKMALATTMQERNRLMNEIRQLEQVRNSPSKLKSFGKTFGRGFKTIGKGLWGGLKHVSRNLDTNAPEFKQMSKRMVTNKKQPFSPLAEMYMPESSSYYSKTPRKMKTPKLKKTKGFKRKKMKTPNRMSREFKRKVNQPAWGLP